jgi:hypothetical protein
MIRRKKIEEIAKLFNFKEIRKDCYRINLLGIPISLYLYIDKPRGWRLQINPASSSKCQVYELNKPNDIIYHLMEYMESSTTERCERKARGLLYDMRNRVNFKGNPGGIRFVKT